MIDVENYIYKFDSKRIRSLFVNVEIIEWLYSWMKLSYLLRCLYRISKIDKSYWKSIEFVTLSIEKNLNTKCLLAILHLKMQEEYRF